MNADSGITLLVEPASMWAMVSTAGSKAFTRRVTMVCRAVTISAAAGIGSTDRCGAEAWPPRPLTRIVILSDEAPMAPPFVEICPDGR